jgi:hypothetical protein
MGSVVRERSDYPSSAMLIKKDRRNIGKARETTISDGAIVKKTFIPNKNSDLVVFAVQNPICNCLIQ